MLNMMLIEEDVRNPLYRYASDEVGADWQDSKAKLLALAKSEKLYFYTWRHRIQDEDVLMFGIGDEFTSEPSLEYELLHDPTAPTTGTFTETLFSVDAHRITAVFEVTKGDEDESTQNATSQEVQQARYPDPAGNPQ